jgi:hypothetical protein
MNEPTYSIKDSQQECMGKKSLRQQYNDKGNKKKRDRREMVLGIYNPKNLITKEVLGRLYRND